ncbi:MAG: hypothetical protein AAFU41_19175 [Pseudomonadota bacterium]
MIGVRDGDQSEIKAEKLFKLPGTQAPEKEVFLSEAAKAMLMEDYEFDLNHKLIALPELDHHEYSSVVSKSTGSSREVIEADAIRAYMEVQDANWASGLLETLEAHA